jgi:hypothetical protein
MTVYRQFNSDSKWKKCSATEQCHLFEIGQARRAQSCTSKKYQYYKHATAYICKDVGQGATNKGIYSGACQNVRRLQACVAKHKRLSQLTCAQRRAESVVNKYTRHRRT